MSDYQIQVSQNFDREWRWRVTLEDVIIYAHDRLYNSRAEAVDRARGWVARDTLVSQWETIDCD